MLDDSTDARDYFASGQDDPGGLIPFGSLKGARIRRRGRRNWWVVLASVGVLLVGGAYWAGTKATSPTALGKQYAPPPRTQLTAQVVFRTLSETLPAQGTVSVPAGYPVNFGSADVPGAQPIVTAKPPAPGTTVANGSLLAQVAGRPVFAMLGATPMYRDLTTGDKGPDVAQLQGDLAALGFPDSDTRGVFGKSTLTAARAFYSGQGYSLDEPDGTLAEAASPRAPSASATAPIPASTPSPSGPVPASPPSPHPPAPSGSPSPSPPPAARPPASPSAPASPAPAEIVPQADIVFIPALPARIQSSSLKIGLAVTNPALTLSTAQPQVTLQLTGAQASIVQPRDAAMLSVTTTAGATMAVAATVVAIRSTGEGTSAGPLAILQPGKPLAWSLAGHQATGNIVIASTGKQVLAVPVAALYTTADGQTLVTVIGADGKRTNVPVQVDAEIAGFVPVQPIQQRLSPGDTVLVGQ